jgi:hypothetical protein
LVSGMAPILALRGRASHAFVPLSLAESAVVVVRVGVVVGGQVMTPARIAMAIMAARSPVPSFRPMRAR